MASLEPKLFCSVARASGFVLCALASACLSNRRRELLRYNNVKRLVRITSAGQRLRTAEPVAALLKGNSDRVRNGRLYGAGNICVKRRSGVSVPFEIKKAISGGTLFQQQHSRRQAETKQLHQIPLA